MALAKRSRKGIEVEEKWKNGENEGARDNRVVLK